MIRRCICFATLSILGLLACSSSDDKKANPATADEVSFEPFPSTVMLDAASVATISASDPDGTIHFPSTAGPIASIKKGSFITGGIGPETPYGFMRYVADVVPEGGGFAAKTINAPPQFLFRRMHVKGQRELPSFVQAGLNGKVGPRTLHPLDGADFNEKVSIDLLVFDGDHNEATTDDQLHLTGTIAGGLSYTFGIDFDWGAVIELPVKIAECLVEFVADALSFHSLPSCTPLDLLPEIKAGISVDAHANADAKAEGVAYLSFERDFSLGSETFEPVFVGPFVFVPSAEVIAKVSGGSSSRFGVGISAEAEAGAGVTVSTKAPFIDLVPPFQTHSASITTSDVVLGAKLKASIGPELSVKLFDIAGPKAGVSIYTEIDADSSQTPCYTQHFGIDGNLGVNVSFDLGPFGKLTVADFEKDFNIFDDDIGSGACSQPPAGQSKKLPGQGPDDQTFATPAFAPTAKVWSGEFGTYPYSAFPGLGFTGHTLSIDGRTLVTGSNYEALTKLDSDGNIVWSEKLVSDTGFGQISNRNSNNFLPSRTAIANDGTIVATAEPFSIASLEQNGDLRWVKYIDGVNGDEFRRFTDIESDGSGGFWLVGNRGANYDQTIGWLLHVDSDGNPLSSKTWGQPNTRALATTLTVLPDQVIVGTYVAFAATASILTFNPDGTFKSGVDLTSPCTGGDIQPTASTLRPDGGYVLAGVTTSLPSENLVLTFDKNGAPGDSAFWKSSDVNTDCVAQIGSIVPLNSTGYLTAGTCDGNNQIGQEAFIGGLDAAGRPLWGHAFGLLIPPGSTLPPGGAEGWSAVHLTDDGGALLTAYADENQPTGQTKLLVAKVFAKDGKITPKAPFEVTADPNLIEGKCTLSMKPTTIVPVDAPVTAKDVTSTVKVQPVVFTKTDLVP